MCLFLNFLFNLLMVGIFLCVVLFSVVVVYFIVFVVEDVFEDGVLDVLEVKNMDWVEVYVEGFNVFLIGVVLQELDCFIVFSVVGIVVDVVCVIDNMDVQVLVVLVLLKFLIEILCNDVGIFFIGFVFEENNC